MPQVRHPRRHGLLPEVHVRHPELLRWPQRPVQELGILHPAHLHQVPRAAQGPEQDAVRRVLGKQGMGGFSTRSGTQKRRYSAASSTV